MRLFMVVVGTAALLSCDPFHTGFEDREPAERYGASELTAAPDNPTTLKVMNWNVKFAGARIDFFFDCHESPGRSLMTTGEVLENLEGLAAKIREVDPDILILQEADVRSRRAAYIDMVQWLLDHTPLNHGAYASQWRADIVVSDGIGRMDSGNAVLSRYPLGEATRIALPLVGEFDALKQHFYLKHNVLTVELLVPGHSDLWVVATHAEAYSQDGTKKLHIDQFKDAMDALVADGMRVVGGGDLNALPPGSEKTVDFPDSVCVSEDFQADDYSEETHWLDPLYADYEPAVTQTDYQANNACHFTHTTTNEGPGGFWNRKLDYLFTNTSFVPDSTITHQGPNPDGDQATACGGSDSGIPTMPLSDHAPIETTWKVGP